MKEQLENEKRSNQDQMSRISSNHSSEINSLTQKLKTIEEKYNSLLQEHKTLHDRYSRAETLHPGLDDKISAMIAEEIRQKDIALARHVDNTLNRFISLGADKNIVNKLQNALSEYSQLSETQKSYVTSDVSKVKTLYNDSLELQKEYEKEQEIKRHKSCAATALAAITSIIACISMGSASNLSSLQIAKSIYDDLDSDSRTYFDHDVANKLDTLLAQAKRDKRRIEEEERRRRQQSMHRSSSTSSFRRSRSHSGFGGRTGGGGAGRKF